MSTQEQNTPTRVMVDMHCKLAHIIKSDGYRVIDVSRYTTQRPEKIKRHILSGRFDRIKSHETRFVSKYDVETGVLTVMPIKKLRFNRFSESKHP